MDLVVVYFVCIIDLTGVSREDRGVLQVITLALLPSCMYAELPLPAHVPVYFEFRHQSMQEQVLLGERMLEHLFPELKARKGTLSS